MVRILNDLDQQIETLTKELHEKYGLKMKPSVHNDFHCVEVLLTDINYPYGRDWMPHMSFVIYFARKVVVLKAVRLPKELRNKGIGTHCWNWLVELCKQYDIEQIEGDAVGAKDFWNKKGCLETPRKTVYSIYANTRK